MAISIRQRDEDVEGVPSQRQEIVGLWTFTARSRHRAILPICAIAHNGIVETRLGPDDATFPRATPSKA